MEYEKRFEDKPVDDPVDSQPCEQSIKDCILLSQDPSDIDFFNNNIESPFDDDWEEYPDNDDGTTVRESIPVGVDYYSLLGYAEKISRTQDVPSKMKQLAEDITGHNLFFETVRERLGSSEAFLGFMLAFIAQNERPKDSEFHYKGKLYKLGRYHYKVEFFQERCFSPLSSDVYRDPIRAGNGDLHILHQLAIMSNVQMVSVNELQKVLAVTPEYTVTASAYDEWTVDNKGNRKKTIKFGNKLYKKTYSELADELIEYIAADSVAQNTADENREKFTQGALVAVDIALLFTGTGAAIRLGGKVAYRVAGEVANVIFMSNQTIEDVTAFLGYNENKGYNVLLSSMRYLDSHTGNTKIFEATYHAANMFVLFGKKVRTKALTGVTSASGGAGIVYIQSFVGQENTQVCTPSQK